MEMENGKITMNGIISKLWLTGDIRDIAIMRFKNGVKRIVVSRNNDHASLYKFM